MRQAILTVAAAALAVGVSACGGSGGAFSFDPVAKAATKTLHAGASKVSIVGDVHGGGRSVHFIGGGVETAHAVDVTVFMNPFSSPSATIREIAVTERGHTILYLTSPGKTGELPSGKKWIRMDPNEIAKKHYGVDPSRLSPTGGQDARQSLKLLERPGSTVRKVGVETVDGSSTMHYHVVVDVVKEFKAAGASAKGLSEFRREFGTGTIPMEVWVDKAGYVHRLRFTYHIQSATASITMTLTDFGRSATIKPPPRDETISFEKFLASGN
jgi:hypothetical protein